MYGVEIRHNFETAHRLSSPNAPVKCQSIHGHSWWATVHIEGPSLDAMGMLVEFGEFKRAWRRFLDDRVDHHLVVASGDPVAGAIRSVQPEARILEVDFDPTTENMARFLFDQATAILRDLPSAAGARIREVHVQETMVNAARWRDDA